MACTDIYSRICVVFVWSLLFELFSLGSSLTVTVQNKYVKVEVLFSSYEFFFLHGVTETHEETLPILPCGLGLWDVCFSFDNVFLK